MLVVAEQSCTALRSSAVLLTGRLDGGRTDWYETWRPLGGAALCWIIEPRIPSRAATPGPVQVVAPR
jgi:hypothetical protein